MSYPLVNHEKEEQEIVSFLKNLRENIIAQFETLEKNAKFVKNPWQHHSGGGGEISLIKGDVFEKAAVNWSGVRGERLPFKENSGPFFATGISLITHMANPHAPTIHMNLRYIRTESERWLGGGYDLTPMGFPYQQDTDHFHSIAKTTLDQFSPKLYAEFSQNAREYFYIPHRKKERGVGGIFFDHYRTPHFENDLTMWREIGSSFMSAIMPIYARRIDMPFGVAERQKQLQLRAHYAEFNLMYDRGTKFGFLSGGNPDAILCSMPPLASW